MLAWRGLLFIFSIKLWTLTPGFADKGCSGFRHLENGRTFFRYGGLYVTFTCNPGFRIHGHRTSSCVSGQWARNPPLCVAPGCSSPGDLLHGSTVVSHDGSLAFFRCDAGFNLFGSALLYCKGKIWNGTKPVCKVADIMSVHLMQESLHEGPEAPVSLKVHLHSHLNTPAVTAPKGSFLKSTLLGVPHISSFTGDKQESIRKTLEKKPLKKPWSDTTLKGEKVRIDILKPIGNLENTMDPIRNVDLPNSPLVESPNVTTISFSYLASTFYKSLSLNSATMPTGFTIPPMDTQELTTTFTNAPYRENEKDLRFTLGTDKPPQRTSVTSAVDWAAFAPNINTLGTNGSPTDTIQSESFITEHSHEATTEGSVTPSSLGFMVSKHVSSTQYLMSTPQSTVSSSCGGLCDQRPELRGTSSPLRSSARTSPSPEVLTVTTQLVSKLPLKVDTTVDSVTKHTAIFKNSLSTLPSKPNLLSQFLRNITSLTSIVYQQGNEKSNHSDLKHLTLDSPSWKDLEIPRFPTRKLRPVCPYPPLPSHGTFYFRSIRNPAAFQYKHYIQYACYPGYTLTNGDVYSYCLHNGQWSGKTPLCLALSPCSLNNGGCSQICQDDGQNRAQCLCKPGFLLLEDQRTCRDLDECVEQLHLCQQVCENTLGSYRCSCNPGFQLSTDQTSCTNINECEEMQEEKLHRCEWKCVNLPGAHRCICPRGYRLHLNGYQCEDMNECELNNGGCSHHCINNRGSYKCACPEMHRISPYNQKQCQPVQTTDQLFTVLS